jgi:hypothetical protein
VFPVKLKTVSFSCVWERPQDFSPLGKRAAYNLGAAASHALCHENSPNATPVVIPFDAFLGSTMPTM